MPRPALVWERSRLWYLLVLYHLNKVNFIPCFIAIGAYIQLVEMHFLTFICLGHFSMVAVAVKLVLVRAEAMQEACDAHKGSMAAVLLKDDGSSQLELACEQARKWCREDCGMEDVECTIANDLYPNCKVIAGNEEALKYLALNVRTFNLSKVMSIPAHGAFHTKLMQRAVRPVQDALQQMQIKEPSFAVLSNVTGEVYKNEAEIRNMLPHQIVQPVKWEQSMRALYANNVVYPETYACGPGVVLLKNLRKIDENAWKRAVKVGD